MIYGSVCSGIEAATVAWEPLGWRAAWYSEIDPFCNTVLEHHYPLVHNLGDITKITKNKIFKDTHIDLLVGGTPCQSFSLAGKREGLREKGKGGLTLEFIKILKEKQPQWFVWENVPGLLSLEKGKDFNSITTRFCEAGYFISIGLLDAADYGCKQSRPRIFVVGYLGNGGPPEEVLRFRPARNYNNTGSVDEEGRIPTLTLRNGGNANARGVAICTSREIMQKNGQTGPEWDKGWEKMGIRACTPKEEEKRQGFSGKHTDIAGCSDAVRYAAIGNSMAVPVMRWIGERIQAVDTDIKNNTFDFKRSVDMEEQKRQIRFKICPYCKKSVGRLTAKHAQGKCTNASPAVNTKLSIGAPSSFRFMFELTHDQVETLLLKKECVVTSEQVYHAK